MPQNVLNLLLKTLTLEETVGLTAEYLNEYPNVWKIATANNIIYVNTATGKTAHITKNLPRSVQDTTAYHTY